MSQLEESATRPPSTIMGLTTSERMTLAWVGALALAGLGVFIWQEQKPPLVIEGSSNPEQTAHWDQALERARQVDVNAASVAELERLPGVGPTLARRIVEYRTAHGRFNSPEDLSQVRGFGSKTYRGLKDYVTVK